MPWLPYLRTPPGPWKTLVRAKSGTAWATRIAAHQEALTLHPDLPTLAMGAIGSTPNGHRYTLAPTDEDPVPAPDQTPRECSNACTIHRHRPLAHLIGHDVTGIRTASTLHRLGYRDLTDITMAMHAQVLKEVRGLGPLALERLQALSQGRTPHRGRLDLPQLAVLFRQLDSTLALHRQSQEEPVQRMLYHLEHARSYLHQIRAEEHRR